jgi:predicted Rossmann fold nucleotide-binding protein DprA/Smf involved in DNA uptake
LIVISGGQTGLDRAAMDAALEAGISIKAYCPKGRLAEDGTIDLKYPLTEIHSVSYHKRTRRNVALADSVLILVKSTPDAGTALTIRLAKKLQKPLKIIHLNQNKKAKEKIQEFLENPFHKILIAGSRESNESGIYKQAYPLLLQCFTALIKRSRP